MSTIVSSFRSRVSLSGDALAIAYLEDGEGAERRFTYADLDARARAIAAQLLSQGAGGERALLLYAPGPDYVTAFLGCLYAGVVAVPAYPPDPARLQRSLPRLLSTVADSRGTILLTTSLIATMARAIVDLAPALGELRWISTDTVDLAGGADWQPPSLTGSSLAFLQYTSGSTANPRGVMLTHDNLRHNLTLIAEAMDIRENTVGMSWLPPYHDMGLIGAILGSLIAGAPLTLMSPLSFLQKPLRWLQAISRHRVEVSGGPNFAYDLCVRRVSQAQAAALDLSCWRTAFSGAEPVRRDTLDAFAEHFAVSGFDPRAFYPCYGLAEATLIVSGGPPRGGAKSFAADAHALSQNLVIASQSPASAVPLVSSGRALGDQRVVIVDPARWIPLPDSAVGEIWVAGPSVATGYWERSEESLTTFRAYLADGTGPFLRTGDLGFLREGELYINGRLKDLIIIRGANHYPQDIERTVEACHPRIRKGCSVAFTFKYDADERLVIVAEVERREESARAPTDTASALMDAGDGPLVLDEIVTAIRSAVTLQHQLQVQGVALIEPRTLPKTSSGKVQRHATRAAFMARTLTELKREEINLEGAGRSTIRPANTLELIKLAARDKGIALVTMVLVGDIARTLNVRRKEIDATRPVNSFGLDSLLSVELTHTLERSLGIVFPVTHFLRDTPLTALATTLYDLVMEESSPSSASSSLPPSPLYDHLLTRGQAALWHLHALGAGAAYNLASAFRIRAELDVERLRQAFQFVVSRHEVLRTTYTVDESGAPTVAARNAGLQFDVVDASSLTGEQVHARAQAYADAPFNLAEGPIVRVALLSRSSRDGADHLLVVAVHHIAADLWSLVVLMNELGKVYAALSSGTVPHLKPVLSTYRAFVRWQEELLSGPETYRSWDFWRNKLPMPLPVLELPTDRPRPPMQSFRGATTSVGITEALSARVRSFARALSVTPYSVLLAAFQALLARYSGQTEFVVGTPVSGRTRATWDTTVGYFVNVLPLFTRVEKNVTVRDLVRLAQRAALDALEHQDYPFVSLVERLAPRRDPSRSPIFDVMFVLERPHLGAAQAVGRLMLDASSPPAEWAGLSLEGHALERHTSQFDLSLTVVDREDRFTADLTFNTDLFSLETGERLGRHFAALLDQLTANPEAEVWRLGFMTPEERGALVAYGRVTPPSRTSIHASIEAQARRSPEAPAVVFGATVLSYRELDERANRLASTLAAAGVRGGDRVAVSLPRSESLPVALLAVLKCGAAYVPIDPEYPEERRQFILADAKPRAVVATSHDRERLLRHAPGFAVVAVDAPQPGSTAAFHAVPPAPTTPESAAYVIYTSGSTGKPKGVVVNHGGVANFFAGMDAVIARRGDERGARAGAWLAITSVSFDISVLELLWTLSRGFKVVVQSAEGIFASATRRMDLGIMFWGQDDAGGDDRYRFFLDMVKRADRDGFSSVWIPERHFHAFGGNYPSPSVLAGAAAVVTERIAIRSGSVVLPLQNPVRVAEEWSVVDNLSRGRVGISVASGWHKNDFVLAPGAFEGRGRVMLEGIDVLRRLWRGDAVELPNGKGEPTPVRTLPRPVQRELPMWLTAAGRIETFRTAGEKGFNLLTHLLGQDIPTLAEKIRAYRDARASAGHDPGEGKVTLMLHTFVHEDEAFVKSVVREPFTRYLEQSVDLFTPLYKDLGLDPSNLSPQDRKTLLEFAFERYFSTSGLFGSPVRCRALIDALKAVGVDEMACLVEFGVSPEHVLASMPYLSRLLPREPVNEPLDAQIARHGITHLQCTPSTARMLLDAGAHEALASLDALLVGGEALPGPLARALDAVAPGRVINMYGPTETTIWSSSYRVSEPYEPVTSIGTPIDNTSMFVVDEHLELVPPGARGELCIGGAGVADGYLDRPELTAQRFVPDPFAPASDEGGTRPPARCFRTGDIVRRRPDGDFQFLGRNDHQVKVRGFRVELGEIEAALERHSAVGSAAVLVRTDPSGDQQLVAYVVARAGGAAVNHGELKSHLAAMLPGYMVPGAFVTLPEMPRTPNGKLDRQALRPIAVVPVREITPPRDTLDQALCFEWSDLLGAPAIGIDDDFFALGGHSLMATRLRSRLAEHLGVELAVADLFRANTVRAQGDLLRSRPGVQERAALLVEIMNEPSPSGSEA